MTLDHDAGYQNGGGHFPVDAIQRETETQGDKITSQGLPANSWWEWNQENSIQSLERLDWKDNAVIFFFNDFVLSSPGERRVLKNRDVTRKCS